MSSITVVSGVGIGVEVGSRVGGITIGTMVGIAVGVGSIVMSVVTVVSISIGLSISISDGGGLGISLSFSLHDVDSSTGVGVVTGTMSIGDGAMGISTIGIRITSITGITKMTIGTKTIAVSSVQESGIGISLSGHSGGSTNQDSELQHVDHWQ